MSRIWQPTYRCSRHRYVVLHMGAFPPVRALHGDINIDNVPENRISAHSFPLELSTYLVPIAGPPTPLWASLPWRSSASPPNCCLYLVERPCGPRDECPRFPASTVRAAWLAVPPVRPWLGAPALGWTAGTFNCAQLRWTLARLMAGTSTSPGYWKVRFHGELEGRWDRFTCT